MIVAGAPSTEEVSLVLREVPTPPGVVMVASQTIARNADRAQSEGRAKEDVATRRGRGQYNGRIP
jgi:hypothetical protein